MESGYHSETGICWQFRNKGDRSLHCKCPACSAPWPETSHALFGRCRSGSRWFWTAYNIGTQKEMFGWADTEGLAMAAAMAAVVNLRNDLLMTPVSCTVMPIASSKNWMRLNGATDHPTAGGRKTPAYAPHRPRQRRGRKLCPIFMN
jgi:hypothetical protein